MFNFLSRVVRLPAILFMISSTHVVQAAEPVHVIADFSVPVDYPLSKSKFAVFNSGMVRPARYDRDAALIGAVHPESMRIDIGWGAKWIGWKTPAIFGTADAPKYDFAEMDQTAAALKSQGVPVYWSYCYTPRPLQPSPGDYRGMPTDLPGYGRIIRDVVAHYRNLPGGDPVGYHEIGNEPDNRDFFTGTRDDYLKLYETGSKAVRDANPDAVVGGPALAFDPTWVDPFLDQAVAKKLPLDFFSFHYYPGIPFKPADLTGRVRLMEDALDKRPQLRTTELHLNEFNSYKIDYPRGGKQDRAPIAAAFLHDVKWFLEQPGLTRVHWAQFMDSGGGNFSGMVSMDGHRKALFNAYLAYSQMPIDRVKFSSDSPDVEGLASFENGVVGVLLWNRTKSSQSVMLHLAGPHPAHGSASRIDADYASWGDHPESDLMVQEPVDASTDLKIDLPVDGIYWLQLGKPVPVAVVPDGRILRDWHDYPKRTARAYADVDRRSWTIREGSAGDRDASATAGFSAERLPDLLVVRTRTDGLSPDGLLAVRVDFHSPDGKGTAVLYRGPGPTPVQDRFGVGWGTGRDPDAVRVVPRLAGFRIDLKSTAPADWDRRADITVMLRNPGSEARVVVSFGR
jgi:xylan 1,4-beta-xylosidase